MRTRAGIKSAGLRRPDSVKDLLGRGSSPLAKLASAAARQEAWQEWVAGHLAEVDRAWVRAASERSGTLTVFAESAAWAARLKFALAELAPRLRAERPQIREIQVRVMPRA